MIDSLEFNIDGDELKKASRKMPLSLRFGGVLAFLIVLYPILFFAGIYANYILKNGYFGHSSWYFYIIYGLPSAVFMSLLYVYINNSTEEKYQEPNSIPIPLKQSTVINFLMSPIVGFAYFYVSIGIMYLFGFATILYLFFIFPVVIVILTYHYQSLPNLYNISSNFYKTLNSYIFDKRFIFFILALLFIFTIIAYWASNTYNIAQLHKYADLHSKVYISLWKARIISLLTFNKQLCIITANSELLLVDESEILNQTLELGRTPNYKKYDMVTTIVKNFGRGKEIIGFKTYSEIIQIENRLDDDIENFITKNEFLEVIIHNRYVIAYTNDALRIVDRSNPSHILINQTYNKTIQSILEYDDYLIVVSDRLEIFGINNDDIQRLSVYLLGDTLFSSKISDHFFYLVPESGSIIRFNLKQIIPLVINKSEKYPSYFPIRLPINSVDTVGVEVTDEFLLLPQADGTIFVYNLHRMEKPQHLVLEVHLERIVATLLWNDLFLVASENGIISFVDLKKVEFVTNHISDEITFDSDLEIEGNGDIEPWIVGETFLDFKYCMICRDEFESQDEIETCQKCFQSFHQSEIYTWISGDGKNKCPVCKNVWSPID